MLSRLEAEGLISREQDWKTKHISLTAKGRELLESAFPSQLEQQSSLFDESLNEDEKVQLHALMKKLYDTSRERGENSRE